VELERLGTVTGPAGPTTLRFVKLAELSADASLSVTYVLTHVSGPALSCVFGSEWNLSPLLFGKDYSPRISLNGNPAEMSTARLQEDRIEHLSAESAALGLRVRAEARPAAALWSVPVEAASASEKGFERTYQGQCLYFQWPLALRVEETARFGLTWRPSGLNQ
ncbi:MAG TPA: alpha-amylase/4-alpha-glucanotransferase domain-containing protein, partial [Dehalococcoidia bacterium]|nr:alpha-amylase/4-alpha-glucanotransferase domain-containing protein [Dehalococcoidia bacterium]